MTVFATISEYDQDFPSFRSAKKKKGITMLNTDNIDPISSELLCAVTSRVRDPEIQMDRII